MLSPDHKSQANSALSSVSGHHSPDISVVFELSIGVDLEVWAVRKLGYCWVHSQCRKEEIEEDGEQSLREAGRCDFVEVRKVR